MFDSLTERLSRTVRKLSGKGRLRQDTIREALREVRIALLEADVSLSVVQSFIALVRERAVGQELDDAGGGDRVAFNQRHFQNANVGFVLVIVIGVRCYGQYSGWVMEPFINSLICLITCYFTFFLNPCRDIWRFMKERKKFWFAPIILVLLLLGLLIVFGGGSAVAPFIYPLF